MLPRAVRYSLVISFTLLLLSYCLGQTGTTMGTRRPTIADSISMTVIGGPYAQWLENGPATFSPDGSHFVVVTHHGNIARNTNLYDLLLFDSSAVFTSPRAEKLVSMETSSNDAAIWSVQWAGNDQIIFLGERSGQKMQVYSFHLRTRHLVQLSRHPTNVFAFDVAEDTKTLVYLGYARNTDVFDQHAKEYGLIVSNQHPADIILQHASETDDSGVVHPFELLVKTYGHGSPRKINFDGEFPLPYDGIFLSPDRKYAVVKVAMFRDSDHVPASWKEYKDAELQVEPFVVRYDLIDLRNGAVRPLLNAPSTGLKHDIAWAANSKSVIVVGTYLPLEYQDGEELRLRSTTPMVVQVDVASGQIKKIVQGNWELVRWNENQNRLLLESGAGSSEQQSARVCFEERGNNWRQLEDVKQDSDRALEIVEEQDMNTPPSLVAVDGKSGRKNQILDLNPQFKQLKFAKVEEITWKTSDGHSATGGLYLPPDLKVGKRYPLVIQTHGWNRHLFWIDGASNAGYAAQALAARDIIVAQVENAKYADPTSGLGTTEEGPRQARVYEGLIDYLDKRGLVDRARVGVHAWSRTGRPIRTLLAFSKYPIAAAVLADSLDGGYMQYLSWLTFSIDAAGFYEKINGGLPFGKGIDAWLKNSPSFNLANVRTPVRILSFRKLSLLNDWEWYAGLLRLGKPVELIAFADAKHDPVKPSERMTVQDGDVDWFCFWLKNEEDPAPNKLQQFARWKKLRDKQKRQGGSGNEKTPT